MSDDILHFYRAIESTSLRMVDSALNSDWNSVAQYETACALIIAQLRERAEGVVLTKEEKKEKSKLMQSILRNDAKLRILAEPWIGKLDSIILHDKQSVVH